MDHNNLSVILTPQFIRMKNEEIKISFSVPDRPMWFE